VRRIYPLIAIALAMIAPPCAAARERWARVDTPTVRVFTSGDPARARHFARMLESFRAFLVKEPRGVAVGDVPPFDVYLFADVKRLEARLGERGRLAGGAHVPAVERCAFLALDADDSLAYLLDDYVGHLLHAAGAPPPRWYRSGLGDYYSTFTLDRSDYASGKPPYDYRLYLEFVGGVPLADVLACRERMAPDPMLYGTAWAFVHFLVSDDALRGRIPAFLEALGKDTPLDEATKAAFDVPLDTLERRFREASRSVVLPVVRVPRGALAPAEPAPTVEVAPDDLAPALDRIGAAIVAARKEAESQPPLPEVAYTPIVPVRPDVGPAKPPEPVAPPPGTWLQLATPHFRIWSESSPSVTREVGRQLETMLAVVGKVSGGLGDLGDPLDVWVFDSKASMTRAYRGESSADSVAGLYTMRGDREALLVLGETVALQRVSVVYHELTHYLTRRRCEDCPAWFHEGFAEYYSTLRVVDGAAQIGRSIDAHVNLIVNTGGMGVADVLRHAKVEPHSMPEEQSRVFYARSWALVYFLLSSGKEGRDGLQRLIAACAAGEPPETAVRNAFGNELTDLDRAIASRFLGRTILPYTTVPLDGIVLPESGEPTPAPPAVVKTRLGELGWIAFGSQKPEALLEPFHAATAADPGYAPAHAGLARALAELGRADEAATAFQEAVKLAPDDPRIARAAGIFQADRLMDTPGGLPSKETIEGARRTRALLERALVERPSDGRALFYYGSLWILDPDADPAPGIAALEASVVAEPGHAPARFNLLVLLVRQGDRAKSREVLDGYARVETDPGDLDHARDLLLRFDVEDARAALQKRDRKGAVAILERALAKARTEEARTRLTEHLRSLSAR
jgi:tetratricopeptide (TPR) repeat protein